MKISTNKQKELLGKTESFCLPGQRPDTYFWEDEDQEDLSSKECVDSIKLHRQIENAEIDEWTIGDE